MVKGDVKMLQQKLNYQQLNCFDFLYTHYKISKPIRLIELFAGIGSQAKALKNIGANFEHYKVIELDKFAIQSYNAIHGSNFKTRDIKAINGADLAIIDTNKFAAERVAITMLE